MANYYFRNNGTNWETVGSWSSTPLSLGYTPVTILPGGTDDVFFETVSAACTVNGATATQRFCRRLSIASNYSKTITLNFDLIVVGNVVNIGNATFAGVGYLTIGLSTSNPDTLPIVLSSSAGYALPNLALGNSGANSTITINNNFNVTNVRHNATGACTTNGNTITVNGNMTMLTSFANWSGTTNYKLVGNGNLGSTSPNGSFGVNIEIAAGSNTITLLPYFRYYCPTAANPNPLIFTHTSGNVDTTTNSNLCTIDSGGPTRPIHIKSELIVFNNVTCGATSTTSVVLLSDMKIGGNLTIGPQAFVLDTSNSSVIELSGNLFYGGNGNAGVGYYKGTAAIKFIGNTDTVIQGTSVLNTSALLIGINLIINKSVGRKVTMIPVAANPTKKIYLCPGGTPTGQLPMSITVTSGSLDVDAGSTVVIGSFAITYTTLLTLNTGTSTVTFPNLNIENAGNQLNIN